MVFNNKLYHHWLKAWFYAKKILKQDRNAENVDKIEEILTHHYFSEAASYLELKHYMLGADVMEFTDGRCRHRIYGLWTDLDALPTGHIASNKPLCSALLAENGLPVPEFLVFSRGELNKAAGEIKIKYGSKVVVKPACGTSSGLGVTAGIDVDDVDSILRAFRDAGLWSKRIMVEEFVEGENYRFLVCKGKILSVVHRAPPFVFGDGKRTLGQLIKDENARRSVNIAKLPGVYQPPVLMPIKMNPNFLKRNGYDVNSIPVDGKKVYCRKETNLGTGGMYNEVTRDVHPEWIALAEKAALVIGINLAGIDIICSDIRLHVEKTQGKINEVNTTPGLAAHYEIMNQVDVVPVAIPVLRAMFDLPIE